MSGLTVEQAEKAGIRSCSSHDSVLTDNESLSQQEDSPVLQSKSQHKEIELYIPDSPPSQRYRTPSPTPLPKTSTPTTQLSDLEGNESPTSPRLKRSASERLKGAKNFLKRMETLKSRRKKKNFMRTEGVEISGPVLMDSPDMQQRIDKMNCIDISPTSEIPPEFLERNRRQIKADLDTCPIGEGTSDSEMTPPVVRRIERMYSDTTSGSYHSAVSTLSDSEESMSRMGGGPTTTQESPASKARFNHSANSNDLDATPGSKVEGASSSSQKYYPKKITSGYIETGTGSQINYRTGSFNLGSDSEQYRDNFLRVQNQGRRGSEDLNSLENRMSVYDNVPDGELDPHKELDLILHDLFKNISGLSKTLSDNETGKKYLSFYLLKTIFLLL